MSQPPVSIHPYFKVHPGKMEAAKALIPRFIAATKDEQGCLYYNFTVNGDTVFCREAYVDAAATLIHLQDVGEILGEMLQLSDLRLEMHGPADELEKLKAAGAPPADWFVYFDGLAGKNISVSQPPVSIHPYFKIHPGQMDAAKALMPKYIAATKDEQGCLHYDFTINGDTLFCRGAYVDSEAVRVHSQNIGAVIGELFKISDYRVEIHGPASEIEKMKAAGGPPEAGWFTYIDGLKR